MSCPLSDVMVKYTIELGLKTIRSNPLYYLTDIFGDAKLDPLAALYGQRTIDQVTNWIQKTEIPVILGFDLVDSKLPAITVNIAGSTPDTQYIGDEALSNSTPLEWQEKEVLVPAFSPASAVWAADRSYITITLPDTMPFELQQLVLPGLMFRDADNREYSIGYDKDYSIIISPILTPLDQINLSRLEVVSPVIDARYSRGGMSFNEQLVVVVHGHASRIEGIWLSNIVMWTLLKYRPLLEGTFGLALSLPSVSDFSKDDSFLGEQVWRRYITLQAKSLWTWESARQKDILGLLTNIQADRVNASPSSPVIIDPKPPGK